MQPVDNIHFTYWCIITEYRLYNLQRSNLAHGTTATPCQQNLINTRSRTHKIRLCRNRVESMQSPQSKLLDQLILFSLTKPFFQIARMSPSCLNMASKSSIDCYVDDVLPLVLSRHPDNITILTNSQLTAIKYFIVGMYNRHLVKHGIELD